MLRENPSALKRQSKKKDKFLCLLSCQLSNLESVLSHFQAVLLAVH